MGEGIGKRQFLQPGIFFLKKKIKDMGGWGVLDTSSPCRDLLVLGFLLQAEKIRHVSRIWDGRDLFHIHLS